MSEGSTEKINADEESETVLQEPDKDGWIAHVDPDSQQTYYINSKSGVFA